MPNKNQHHYQVSAIFLGAVVVVSLVMIAIASLTNVALAIRNDHSNANVNVVRTQCLNGLVKAAVDSGVCSLSDLMQISGIFDVRESQGIQAAKAACFSQLVSPGCRGLCTAAINCYDLQL